MSMPALEAFGTVAFRVAHSEFRNTNVQQPGDTDRLRLARDIATLDLGSGWQVSSSMCIVARGSRPKSPPEAGCPGCTPFGTGRLVCTCEYFISVAARISHSVTPPRTVVRYRRLGQFPGITARGRVSRVNSRSIVRPEQCIRYVQKQYRVYSRPQHGIRDARKQYHRPWSVRRPGNNQQFPI